MKSGKIEQKDGKRTKNIEFNKKLIKATAVRIQKKNFIMYLTYQWGYTGMVTQLYTHTFSYNYTILRLKTKTK